MKVVQDSILVKLPPKEEQTSSGIVLVGKEEDTVKPMWVEVVSVGPEVKHVRPNTWALAAIDRKSSDTFKEGDEKYAKITEISVFAVTASYEDIESFNVDVLDKDVLVYDMSFGEQKTTSGIIVSSDNGKTRGIHPRWAKVYRVGANQKDVSVDQWVLIEHGRWTRGFELNDGTVIRKIDTKAMIAVSDKKPDDLLIGEEYGSQSSNIKPEDFIKQA